MNIHQPSGCSRNESVVASGKLPQKDYRGRPPLEGIEDRHTGAFHVLYVPRLKCCCHDLHVRQGAHMPGVLLHPSRCGGAATATTDDVPVQTAPASAAQGSVSFRHLLHSQQIEEKRNCRRIGILRFGLWRQHPHEVVSLVKTDGGTIGINRQKATPRPIV